MVFESRPRLQPAERGTHTRCHRAVCLHGRRGECAHTWEYVHSTAHPDTMRACMSACVCVCVCVCVSQGAQPNERDHRIFSAGMDQTVRLWDPYDMACVRVHEESHSEITAMTFYEAWNILVTGEGTTPHTDRHVHCGPASYMQRHRG